MYLHGHALVHNTPRDCSEARERSFVVSSRMPRCICIYTTYIQYMHIYQRVYVVCMYTYIQYIYIHTQPRERRRHESSCITQCTLPTQRKRLGSCIYVYNIYCNICMYAYRYVVRICEQCENAFKTISYSTKTPWSNYICMYFIYAYTYIIYICEQCANIFTTIRYRYSTQRLASSTYI